MKTDLTQRVKTLLTLNSKGIHPLLTFVTFNVAFKFLLVLKRSSAQVAGVRLVFGVGPSDVAVVGGVGGEGLPAVLALEGPLSGVLADVCSQDAGGGEGLEEKTFSFVKFTVLVATTTAGYVFYLKADCRVLTVVQEIGCIMDLFERLLQSTSVEVSLYQQRLITSYSW